jgi:hypothetical protein
MVGGKNYLYNCRVRRGDDDGIREHAEIPQMIGLALFYEDYPNSLEYLR